MAGQIDPPALMDHCVTGWKKEETWLRHHFDQRLKSNDVSAKVIPMSSSDSDLCHFVSEYCGELG